MAEPSSKTERESFFFERLAGGDHAKTTITDESGNTSVGRGATEEEAQQRASDAYHGKK